MRTIAQQVPARGAGFVETGIIVLRAAFGVDSHTAPAVTPIGRGIFYAYGLVLGGACLSPLTVIYGRQS